MDEIGRLPADEANLALEILCQYALLAEEPAKPQHIEARKYRPHGLLAKDELGVEPIVRIRVFMNDGVLVWVNAHRPEENRLLKPEACQKTGQARKSRPNCFHVVFAGYRHADNQQVKHRVSYFRSEERR